jgi:peptidoglycan LD-endopeptidase LytH
MKRFFIFFVLVLCISCKSKKHQNKITEKEIIEETKTSESKPLINICKKFETLSNAIRDKSIDAGVALKEVRTQLPEIKAAYYKHGGKDWPKSTWVFPLQNYDTTSIGGSNGNGYIPGSYNYFHGNDHKGHAAHDIFIKDANQDCKDDRTNEFVNVLSFSGGVVLATETMWDTASQLRGGKYIWVYDPYSNSLFYYAHNNSVNVQAGQLVRPGQVLATVGRSGLNAYKKRSPTHLHFTQLVFDGNYHPKPVNIYPNLIKAKKL